MHDDEIEDSSSNVELTHSLKKFATQEEPVSDIIFSHRTVRADGAESYSNKFHHVNVIRHEIVEGK